MKIQNEKNRIIIGSFPDFFVIGGVTLIMSFMMIYEIYTMMSVGGYDFFDIILPFVFVAVMWGLTVYCLKRATAKIEVNDDGVFYRDLFTSYGYRWASIRDFGISYSGNGRNGGTFYNLYFSVDEQETRSAEKKKLRGKMIKLLLDYDESTGARDKVIPFCKKRTGVVPFVSKALKLW